MSVLHPRADIGCHCTLVIHSLMARVARCLREAATAPAVQESGALKDCGIESANAGERLMAEIKAFYAARKDRRIKKGCTPSDNGKLKP